MRAEWASRVLRVSGLCRFFGLAVGFQGAGLAGEGGVPRIAGVGVLGSRRVGSAAVEVAERGGGGGGSAEISEFDGVFLA